MKVLVLGASGATGRLVVTQLLRRNISSRLVIRKNSQIPGEILPGKLVEIIRGNISEFDSLANIKLIKDCDAIVCCLGHNMTLKGIFGQPRMLVSGALQNICDAINEEGNRKYKIVLMNTAGNVRKEESNILSLSEKIILGILKALLPPHNDNVSAANYLLEKIGNNNSKIEWIIVRPDTLVDQKEETPYEVYKSPTRSPIFNAGKTSRINVSHFIAELLASKGLWRRWNNKMPVIYNKGE